MPITDLPVVHTDWSGNRPPQPWLMGTSLYGTVSERDEGELRPVAGATVNIDAGYAAAATTSATGFYMICSMLASDYTLSITARKTGYNPDTRKFVAGFDAVVNFELTRR